MEVVKKVNDMSIIKKRSGRYGVLDSKGKWLNGEAKVSLLKKEGLIKVSEPKKEETVAEEEVTPTQDDTAKE